MRLAMVGCGAIASWHLRALRSAAGRTAITAVVDPVPERASAMAAETGAASYASVDDALDAGAFDAALVMVPHHLHEAVAIQLLKAGKHVLLEKPLATTLEACDRILEAAEASGHVFAVAENAQYWPEVLIARDLIENGAIGEVVTARAWFCAGPPEEFYAEGSWRFSASAAGGGVAIDTGSHWLRPLRMWLGELDEVLAVTARPYPAMEGESLCRALCRFDSGVVASFDVIVRDGPVAPVPMFQITGTSGELTIDGLGRVKLYDGTDQRGTVAGQGNYLQSYEGQAAAFEAAVLDGQPLPVDAAYALGELRGAFAMYRSA